MASANDPYEKIHDILRNIISPSLCIFGIIGNTLNLLVLTRRRMRASQENMIENMGFIALAVSDFLFCLCSLPEAFIKRDYVYYSRSFKLYYRMYGIYPRNALTYSSTWLTVVMAMSRYVAICHPMHARIFIHPGGKRLAIFITFFTWCCLAMPEAWTYTLTSHAHDNITLFIIDLGPFMTNKSLHDGFAILWSIVGFVIPISILAFCNVHLIRALRASYCLQGGNRDSRITPTLIAVIVMFLILVSPSEILNIYRIFTDAPKIHELHLAITFTNLMHTMNFSINFLLYCSVNVHFRKTLKDIFCRCKKWRSTEQDHSQSCASDINMKTMSTMSFAPGN